MGTLAYLAPEQTGRTGRPVDQRADLYALGATLYELATGAPPFGSGDPLRLIHDHLARVPVPPARGEPGRAGAAVARSSCTCWRRSRTTATRPPRAWSTTWSGCGTPTRRRRARCRVGEHDVPLRLLPPSRLVGRDAEVAALEAAFEDALAGRCRGVLVGGAPGVGKTALVDELRPVVTGADGWFVAGKFDQYRRDLEFDAVASGVPRAGPAAAGRAGGRAGRASASGSWRRSGPNAGLLTAVVPEFAALLAVPPDPGDPLTAQVRAQRNGGGDPAGGRVAASGRWWCSSTTCSGPGAPRSASSTWC